MKRIPMTSMSQEWRTPRAFYQALNSEFDFDFDPCPTETDYALDGLSCDWGDRNFVNPPFKDIKEWIRKGYREHLKGKAVVFLIPSRTDTAWWHNYIMKASEIRFIRGRLRYEGAKFNAPFPSCVVIFNGAKAKGRA